MGMTIFSKVDAALDSNPKIRRGGRNAREVFCFVLRKNAERGATGAIPAGYVDIDYLADHLMTPHAEVNDGLARAIAVGLLAIDDGEVVILGWDDQHGRGPLSVTERKRNQRAREKAQRENATLGEEVTIDRDLSRQSRDAVTVTDQRDQRERAERESLARTPAGDPSTPVATVPSTRTARSIAEGTVVRPPLGADPDVIARRKLGDRAWDRLNHLRRAIAAEMGLGAVLPLGEHDPGRRELADRVIEAGDQAKAHVTRAFEVLEHEARATRSIEWLAGKSFGAKAWARLVSQPPPKRSASTTAAPREPTLEERAAHAARRIAELDAEEAARALRAADPTRVRVTPSPVRIRGGEGAA